MYVNEGPKMRQKASFFGKIKKLLLLHSEEYYHNFVRAIYAHITGMAMSHE